VHVALDPIEFWIGRSHRALRPGLLAHVHKAHMAWPAIAASEERARVIAPGCLEQAPCVRARDSSLAAATPPFFPFLFFSLFIYFF
jgi:hypothetical protein